jgi:hypothetical protein
MKLSKKLLRTSQLGLYRIRTSHPLFSDLNSFVKYFIPQRFNFRTHDQRLYSISIDPTKRLEHFCLASIYALIHRFNKIRKHIPDLVSTQSSINHLLFAPELPLLSRYISASGSFRFLLLLFVSEKDNDSSSCTNTFFFFLLNDSTELLLIESSVATLLFETTSWRYDLEDVVESSATAIALTLPSYFVSDVDFDSNFRC